MYILAQLGFIVTTLFCLWLILKQLRTALILVDFSAAQRQRVWLVTLLTIGGWLAFLSIFSLNGFFGNFSSRPPRIAIAALVPFVVLLVITFSRFSTPLLKVIPPQRLLYIQSFRVAVELLLWLLFVQHRLPVQMTFEGQNWDVLIGLTAPVLAYFCFVKGSWSRSIALVWNVLGLLLLANIVTISILSMPTVFRMFMNDPPNIIMAQFPFIWLPGVLVPIAYAMHFFSIKQLLMARRPEPKAQTTSP
uniref:Uncharacterized protein n=1 Tax=Roseihalotalea indica TaxID=2867963 RepID=A0AA49JGQ2_9BACT|nr:hypothetical protein K4G66_03075 [Tunicatimonas sp. TK19036]